MAKKLGKIVLFTAAVASVATAVYYFMQKKEREKDIAEEEDFDDFSDDTDKTSESSRNYVPLNSDAPAEETETDSASESETPEKEPEGTFTPLSEQVSQAADKTVETVEEFFDEEDGSDEEPPINDNME